MDSIRLRKMWDGFKRLCWEFALAFAKRLGDAVALAIVAGIALLLAGLF